MNPAYTKLLYVLREILNQTNRGQHKKQSEISESYWPFSAVSSKNGIATYI